MKIYMIRHGETPFNLERRYQGMYVETMLTERGREQARAASRLLEGISLDYVYVSPSVRTMETARLLLPQREHFIPLEELRETDVGRYAERLRDDCIKEDPALFEQVESTKDFSLVGGESFEMLKSRAKRALDLILEQGGDCVLVVSHGGLIRALLTAALDVAPEVLGFAVNCALSAVNVTETGNRLILFNQTAVTASETDVL